MLLIAVVSVSAAELTAHATASKAAGQFGQEMRNKLIESLKKNGPSGAIDVCAKDAPTISSRIEHEYGVLIKRTSLKVRNPQNTPDSLEKELLESLSVLLSTGKPLPVGLVAFPNNQHRFYKTVQMEKACLQCHGELNTINELVRKEIAAIYPDDRAIGYKEGELRGIISVTVK
jgi:hypothetical protein